MNLTKLTLKNFRPFEDAELEVPNTGILLILGPNNSGKTALLSAFDLLRGKEMNACRTIGRNLPAEVGARFALTDESRERLFANAGVNELGHWMDSSALREIEYGFSDDSGTMIPSALKITAPDGRLILVAQLNGYRNSFRFNHANISQALLDEPSALQSIQMDQGAGGGLSATYLLDNAPYPLQGLLETWSDGFFHFRALRPGTERSRTLRSSKTLEPSGENLPEALIHLKNNEASKWERIRGVMQEIVPDIGTLETPSDDTAVEVAFRDPFLNELQNVKDLGTGVEQLLLTTFVGICQPSRGTVIIEEMETNLHPGAQRRLYSRLREWADDRLFVLSTHSTVFLDQAAQDSRAWLVEKEKGRSRVRLLNSDGAAGLLSLGVRYSDILSAERILVVEGPTDVGALGAWFPTLRSRALVSIVPAGGGDRAAHMSTLQAAINTADSLERKLLFLRDRDELSAAAVKRLAGVGCIHVLARRELENYLLEPEAILSHLTSLVAASGKARALPDAEQIDRMLAEGAASTRSLVVLKRVVSELGSLRMASRDDIRELAEPSLAGLQLIVARNVEKGHQMGAALESLWNATEAEVSREWPTRWREIAPGEELLSKLWHSFGFAFNKARDGVGIASAMKTPPAELQTLFGAFLT